MNNPDDMPIDIGEMMAWLEGHKSKTGLSWAALARESGIPAGTLSQLATNNYAGDRSAQARRIFRYRQKVDSQAERSRSALIAPRYVPTPTSRRIQFLLEVAQMGRMTVGAMGPGLGKTVTARHYRDSVQPVWLATMRQTTKTTSAMIGQVMGAMGLHIKSGWLQQRSSQVIDRVAGSGGLIIIDEANHLDWAALEEIRAWHDETGVGVTLLGNEELIRRIRGGADRHQYARLASRLANVHVQDLPIEGDIEAYLDAVDIIEPDMRRPLIEVGVSMGHGGMREVQQILESANMLSIADDQPLGLEHLTTAMKSRTTSMLRRAA